MKDEYILALDDSSADLAVVGGKGASLSRLSRAGLPVPGGFHVTTAAYDQFVSENSLQPLIHNALGPVDVSEPMTLESASREIERLFLQAQIPEEVVKAVVRAYEALPGDNPPVAVRSSATAEDLPELSFAGQQETFLNIQGNAAVTDAVKRCWASLWTGRAIGYRMQHGFEQNTVSLAVVVQLLVPAEASGILFTANPLTGRREQIVINAAWGLGEAIVGGLMTPDTLIVEKASGRVLEREIADKQRMTVRSTGGTVEQAVPKKKRRAAVLTDRQVDELVHLAVRIENLYEMPMDIEWVLAGEVLAIVQARPITALPEPEPPVPVDWKLPSGVYMAMRNNIVELMADPLTPLFGTLGRAAVNTSMGGLLTEFFGQPGIMPEELIISVNDYAYYNGSIKFGTMVKIIFGAPGILKRMFTGAVERWTEVGKSRYVAVVQRWETSPWRGLPNVEILGAVRELAEAAIDAYGSLVSGVIPAAWITEGMFTLVYKMLIKRRDDPLAPTFLMGYDSLPIQAEKGLYELAEWVHSRPDLAAYLEQRPATEITVSLMQGQLSDGVNVDDWHTWRKRFMGHLQQYGHTIYNLDFSNPLPADDPTPLLETFKWFVSQGSGSPHARQQKSIHRRERAMQDMRHRLRGLRLKLFEKTIQAAQRFAPLREDGLADIGLGYPLLRQMLCEMGRRFVERGMIEQPEDIFWLNQQKVERAAAALDRGEALSNLTSIVPERKAAWRAARRASPPLMLPQMKIFGRDIVELKSGGLKKRDAGTLKGVAASPGVVTAPACVLNGPEDFSRMNPGDVLVAPLTTPAWTPLFARAAAVVTDVGGPLSHGSIVAREYGIPAVLGTGDGTKRIRSGQVITVDGSAGVVMLPDQSAE